VSAEAEGGTGRLRYRIAFFVASLVVLGLVVTLPGDDRAYDAEPGQPARP
jgi:hypothetical protein